MRTKPFVIATIALMAALGMTLCAPRAGCSRCGANQGSGVIEKSTDSESTKKEARETIAPKGSDSATSTNTGTAQDASAAIADAQVDDSANKSSTSVQATQGKTIASKSIDANGNGSKPTEPQKK